MNETSRFNNTGELENSWQPGICPVAVIMITLNEGHNMEAVLQNLQGWAQEVFLVDSYSADDTVNIALHHGAYVVQRKFRGFGDQRNFALNNLPITASWTIILDPDERLTEQLKSNILSKISENRSTGISFDRRLWFMGKPLPIKQKIVRVWKTGKCRFTDVAVNEHPIVEGSIEHIEGYLEHHDSPDLHHWVDKQNRYTTSEAIGRYRDAPFAVKPELFAGSLALRMWFKKYFFRIPFRYQLLYLANLYRVKPWTSGYAGFAWARQRVWVRRLIEDKLREMKANEREISLPKPALGEPHPGALQHKS